MRIFFHRRQLRRSQGASFVAINCQLFVEFHHQFLRHLIRDRPQAHEAPAYKKARLKPATPSLEISPRPVWQALSATKSAPCRFEQFRIGIKKVLA
jgi:hypothetical protein